MNTSELLYQARTTYPPTQILLSTVCTRIGSPREIANALKLDEWGRQRVRNWINGKNKIPFSVWLTLLVIDNEQD